MNNPAGFGGVLLLLAAVVWLIIFVPGYASRSQLAARTTLVRRSQREATKSIPLTPQQRLIRLTSTQRGFGVLFALSVLAATGSAVAAIVDASFWLVTVIAGFFGLLSVLMSSAAGRAAAKIAKDLHANRARIRSSASRTSAQVASRDWTPNPLPSPLTQRVIAKEEPKLAEVIDISGPARSISSKELDEILARRRAI